MIQIWSRSSTDTPMVIPISQWFGNGLGHSGSTSNRGAVTAAASAADLLLRTADPTPSATISARKIMPTERLRFILLLLAWVLSHYTRISFFNTALIRPAAAPHFLLVSSGVKEL